MGDQEGQDLLADLRKTKQEIEFEL